MNQLAQRISSFFVSHSLLPKNEEHIYTYCFEVILSGLFAWGSILILAILTHTLFPTLLYIGGFFIFRRYAGGYHAETHLKCYLLSLATYLFFLILTKFIPESYYLNTCIVFIVIASLNLLCFSPIEHKNNPFTKKEKEFLKKKILFLMSIFLFIILVMLYINYINIVFFLSCGYLQAALSVTVAFYFKRREKKLCEQFSPN